MDGLEQGLRRELRGEVDFGVGARAMYAHDASNYRVPPRGVVYPADPDDVVAAVALAREHDVPLTPRGGGTSVAGNAIGPGLVVDMSRHVTRIHAIDPGAGTATVEPGVILDDLQRAAAPHGLRFGPDPSTHSRCTLGGMIGNDACGPRSVAWGRTSDNVLALDALRYDGVRVDTRTWADPRLHALADENLALIRTSLGQFARQVSGYGLDRLLPEHGRDVAKALVGTEGTCVTVLGATVRLVAVPRHTALLVFGFPDDVAAADAVGEILPHAPLTVEGIDSELVPGRPVDGDAWLFVEFGGESLAEAQHSAQALAKKLGRPARVVTEPAERRALWRVREEGAGTATRMPDGAEAWPGWEDAAVPPANLAAYLRDFRALKKQYGLRGATYGHFGEGCLHVRLDFDLLTPGGRRRFRAFVTDAADVVRSHGGSVSGEHGDGRARSELLERLYGPAVTALFAQFKAVWDPGNRMNPGVLVEPAPLDRDLKLDRPPLPLATAFTYPDDGGDLARATRRCVGVGKCRNTRGTVMCPSYQATGEERHSTRGRARLLFELARGDLVTDGWRSTDVRDALELCLGCKACRSECPVGVDMATYKAEFLHHHYRRRLRPLSHYTMGWLPLWARLAPPRLANALAPRLVGDRGAPRLTSENFVRWFRRRPRRSRERRVVLWPDTFTTFYTPQVGRAAVAVLESLDLEILLPDGAVCCGLPWISTGQLGVARAVARRSLGRLPAGVPVVGLEPSCTAALRADVPELLGTAPPPIQTLAEFLTTQGFPAPRLDGQAIVQPHCHQRAVLGTAPDDALLAGLDRLPLEPGCCGMAGNFGFDHPDVATAIAERTLLPAVRAAPDALLLADGFSCRLQIARHTGRHALHLAELLHAELPAHEGQPPG